MSEEPDVSPSFLGPGPKYEAMARFHAGLAHDLNNRLTTILGNLLLFESLYPNESEALEDMRHAAEQASHLVRLVQTFSCRELLPPHPVSVNETLRTLHDLLQRLLGPGCRLSVILSDLPLYVLGDEGALEQVLAELVGQGPQSKAICLKVEKQAGEVVIIGEGAGDFIETETLQALLGYFNAELKPTPRGWRVHFMFCELDGGAVPEPPLPGTGLTVLLAEGDSNLRGLLKRSLEENKFTVADAMDVLEVRALLESGSRFDVAALDVLLPGGGMDRLLACGGLPANAVWLLPFEGWDHAIDMTALAKPFKPCDLHKALMISAS